MTLNSIRVDVDKFISDYMHSLLGIPDKLFQGMKYSVLNGGKRLRPILCCLGAMQNSYEIDEVALKVGTAVELIHCYSLVHDDMPCMDNDTLRRNNPTTHIKYGEGMALLIGDALLTQALELLTELSVNSSKLSVSANYIIKKAGNSGMLAGQCIDINAKDDIQEKDIIDMYRGKTSALFKASLVGGALIKGYNIELNNNLEMFGDSLGIAYQIADDILDNTGDIETLGKNIGSDKANDKKTIVASVGMERAIELKKKYEDKAIKYASKLPKNDLIFELLNQIINRNM